LFITLVIYFSQWINLFFYLCIPLRKEGLLAEKLALLKGKKERNNDEKIKLILFGSWEKIPTFALPTERKGEKKSSGGCHGD
jgi:hypothetical protein